MCKQDMRRQAAKPLQSAPSSAGHPTSPVYLDFKASPGLPRVVSQLCLASCTRLVCLSYIGVVTKKPNMHIWLVCLSYVGVVTKKPNMHTWLVCLSYVGVVTKTPNMHTRHVLGRTAIK